ncbi:PEP-CTERM sorting domain-containing protein [Armatimonas sp.]|uniref:PEP-CTERM sorting domain-containing protein n=1 Tax=Armatimonas sp. TaxID=1872638 RepID=UPI00286D544D|nr:PEP-CTERM sorting domain-containing protein [Armatimonas sp.]
MKKLKLSLATLLVALIATSAHAQLTVNLLLPSQSGPHNGTVFYDATLTNSGGGALDITGSSFTILGAPAGLNLDDSPLFSNFPTTFAVGDSFTGTLFNLFIGDAATIPAGTYFGDFTVETTAGNTTQNWQLTVVSASSAPEPASVALLLLGTLVIVRRRQRSVGKDRSERALQDQAGA